jgi:hypothetical protein
LTFVPPLSSTPPNLSPNTIADSSKVAALNPAYLSALQFAEHAESATLSAALHAAANDPAAMAAATEKLAAQRAGTASSADLPAGGGNATVQLLLMTAMIAGVDAKAAPLTLKAEAALGTSGSGGHAMNATQAAAAAELAADLRWLRRQQAMYAAKAGVPGPGKPVRVADA